ncbi:MAG: leucine-rich repeat domain-containing protein [Clostridia bacterium]|nr:leucine-rich repeat domain-containing protein [Clostridia bacterium]
MKKKIFLILAIMAMLVCAFAISVSAASLSNFINVELTLDDDSEIEAYLEKGTVWSGYQGYSRVTLYTDYTDKSQTIDWSRVRVFDGRNSTIHTYDGTTLTDTGAFAQTLLGYPDNVSNVTHFYYTQGSVIVADNSFNIANKGWNIEYLYVPKSVKKLGNGICNGSTKLTKVEIESGSVLEEIGGSAFRDCTALTSINLQDTQLKTISGADGNGSNGNVFKGCVSLTSIQFPQTIEYIGYNAFFASGLCGKVVLPNSVTHLGPGAFLATPIETMVIGDGPVTIGFNFMGSFFDNNVKFENTYLKEVYIPSEATLENAKETWRKCTNQVTFYVIGDDCTELINSLKLSTATNHLTIGMADDENATTYGGVIVEGHNRCTAFYNGEHLTAEQTYDFTSFAEKSYVKSICSRCNQGTVLKEIAPLFTCLGYSAPENGKGGIAIGFTVNSAAIAEYKKVTGKTLSYGVFAAIKDRLNGSDIFVDGEANECAIVVDMTTYATAAFEIKIIGFETDDQKNAQIAMGAYVKVDNDYSYMQNSAPDENEKYCFDSFNDIVGNPAQ